VQGNLAVGQYGANLLPSLEPARGPGIVSTPLSQTHYFSEEINDYPDNRVQFQVFELTAQGYDVTFSITVPASQKEQLITAIKSLKSPPIATPTDIVHFMQSHTLAREDLVFAEDQLNGRDRWIVIGGNPATAQEEFALFRTTNGGHSWTLADYTTFTGRNNFLGMVGDPALYFWNANDGIVAEAASFGQSIEIQYTTDGGAQWITAKVPKVGEPSGSGAPVITRSPNGTLNVTAVISPKKSVTVQSTNNGKTWVAVSKPVPTPNTWPALIRSALHWLRVRSRTAPMEGPTWIPTVSRALSVSEAGSAAGSYVTEIWETKRALPFDSAAIYSQTVLPHPLLEIGLDWPWRAADSATVAGYNLGWLRPQGPARAVALGNGLRGLEYRSGHSALGGKYGTSVHAPIMVWHEGKWTFEVTGILGAQVKAEADIMVGLLNTWYLPPHVGVGVVNVTAHGPVATLDWEQNSSLAYISTMVPSSHNPYDVIRMAASWMAKA
jgi:hypothetical protein